MVKKDCLDPGLISRALLVSPKSDHELVKSLHLLKENFTASRDKISAYRDDSKLIGAYAWFYLTTNLPKFSFVLDQLSENLKNDFFCKDFIDLGTGPGTYILAHYLYNQDFSGNYYGVDISSKMLLQAEKILTSFGVNSSKLILKDSLTFSIPENPILFFGNSINEMNFKDLIGLVKKINPSYVMFIEPGTKESFEKIMMFREELFKQGYFCQFPCPGKNVKCPMVMIEDNDNRETDWCHQVLRFNHHPDVQRIAQMAQLNRNIMPMISHLYSKADHQWRKNSDVELEGFLVQKINESKHSFHWKVCLDCNSHKGLYNLEFYKKNLDKKLIKRIKKLSTGCRIEFKIIKEVGNKNLRIELVNIID